MSRTRLTASVTERLDRIATELEQAGRPDMALTLDRVSDRLENRTGAGVHPEPWDFPSAEERKTKKFKTPEQRKREYEELHRPFREHQPIWGPATPYSGYGRIGTGDTIKKLYEQTKELNPAHAETLIGERKKGSKWGENLTEKKLVSLPWKEYRGSKMPGVMLPFCDYYKLEDAAKHFPGSRQRVETLEDAEKKGYKLKVVTGEHGNKEIVSPDVKDSPIIEAWLVVGPAENAEGKEISGKKMIWTLFPGILTGSDPKWDGKIESIPEDKKKYVAVKGV